MDVRFVRKDPDSVTENCPALYDVTSGEGGHLVQGRLVDPREVSGVRDLAPGEVLMWVPDGVIHDQGETG
jgi:hypothetical protein